MNELKQVDLNILKFVLIIIFLSFLHSNRIDKIELKNLKSDISPLESLKMNFSR